MDGANSALESRAVVRASAAAAALLFLWRTASAQSARLMLFTCGKVLKANFNAWRELTVFFGRHNLLNFSSFHFYN